MADYNVSEATIVSKGDMQQIHYEDRKTGQPRVFTKFTVECQVGDETVMYEGGGTDHPNLNVGSKYAFEMQDKGQYNDVIRKWTLLGAGQSLQASSPEIVIAANGGHMPEYAPPKVAQKTDLPSRWREYNSNARLAQMQATDRTGKYIDLLIAGKLTNDAGEVVEKVRKSTIENWYSEEIDRYWQEHDVRVPQDIWGHLDGSSDDNN